MKHLNFFLIAIILLILFSCKNDKNLCDCDLDNKFDTIVYKLESVNKGSFSVYTSNGIEYPIDNFDTIVQYSFYKYFSGIDSIYFTSNKSGEYFGNYRFLEDTLVTRTLFSYVLYGVNYKLIPDGYSSTEIIDQNVDGNLRALIYGKDDNEIIKNLTRIYIIEGDKLTIQLMELRLSRGSTTITFPAQSYDEGIKNVLNLTERFYEIKYSLTYKRK